MASFTNFKIKGMTTRKKKSSQITDLYQNKYKSNSNSIYYDKRHDNFQLTQPRRRRPSNDHDDNEQKNDDPYIAQRTEPINDGADIQPIDEIIDDADIQPIDEIIDDAFPEQLYPNSLYHDHAIHEDHSNVHRRSENHPQVINVNYPGLSGTIDQCVHDEGFLNRYKAVDKMGDLSEFAKYFRALQRKRPYVADRNHYVLRDWDKHSHQLVPAFQIVTVTHVDDHVEAFCHCKEYKMHHQCKHTLATLIGIHHQEHDLFPLFIPFEEANQVADGLEDVLLISTRVGGRRKEAYYVDVGDKPEIVYVNNDGCITCLRHKQSVYCQDRLRLMEVLGIDHDDYKNERADINIESSLREFKLYPSHSTKSVPVPKVHRTEVNHIAGYDDYVYESSKFIDAIFTPEYSHCSECKEPFITTNSDTNEEIRNYTINSTSHTSILYTLGRAYIVSVEDWECRCGNIARFDGRDQHVLNQDGLKLYTHSLLNHRTNHWHKNRASSWQSWRSDFARTYIENGSPEPFPSEQTVKNAWNSFVNMVQAWGYDFRCEWCDRGGDNKGEVNEVGYDGIVVFLKQFRALNCVNPTTVYDDTETVQNKISLTSNRYIRDYKTRSLAQRFYQTYFDKYWRETKLDPISQRECRKLFRQLDNQGYTSLKQLLEWIKTNINELNEQESLKENLQHVIRAIVSNEIVLGLFHPKVINIFILDDDDDEDHKDDEGDEIDESYKDHEQTFKQYSPLLWSILFNNNDQDIELPPCFFHMLKHAAGIANELLNAYIEKQQHETIVPTEEQLNEYTNWMTSGSYYSATKKRNRPRYQTDIENKLAEEDEICSKNFVAFSKRTGGIWQIRCLIHQICLGFHVIPVSEGKNDPFAAVYTHFSTAPEVMMGDFSCQVHPYCMSREAEYFKNTSFPSDKIHHGTHCRCSECYNEEKYKQKGLQIYSLWNGVGVEERNRVIAKLKQVSVHMCLEQFMIQLRLLLEMDNRRLIRYFKDIQ